MQGPRQHGPWQIHDRREVYHDPWIHVTRDQVTRPDGKPGSHVIVQLKAGVSVLPLDDEGRVHLTREFHYAVGRETIEVVSGGIDDDENAEAAARRELAEELGIAAREWIDLGVCDPFTSVVVSPTRLYLARGLSFGTTAPEGTEQIGRVAVLLDEAVAMVFDGRMTHAPSCLAILKAWHLLHGPGAH